MEPKHIVVIGASAGGLSILRELVQQIKPEWDAAYFIVLHVSHQSVGNVLLNRLEHCTTLPCLPAKDLQPVERGHIYVGVPNLHLIVKKGEIREGHGPEENRWRPSIDVLFRSAAAAYDSRVTGVILTGLMNDGTSGMWAIKRSGGATIVQNPNEAEYSDMPLSVLNKMEVDHCVSVSEMGAVLEKVLQREVVSAGTIPNDVKKEAEIAEKMATGMEATDSVGSPTVYSCPDCGGVLRAIKEGDSSRFRCHTGHTYTERDLLYKMGHNTESALWVALRIMEERRNLLQQLENQTRERGFSHFANNHKQKGEELREHIEQLKKLLTITQDNHED